jgi:Ca-activated chloride channel homolog
MELKALADFHFLYPLWLLALLPVWAVAGWLGWRRREDGNWGTVIDAELLSALRLAPGGLRDSPWWLIALGWSLAVLALAGPAWQREKSVSYRAPGAWVMVLDLSPSMAAADLAPNRATRARYAVDDLLGAVRDQRVALLAFADEPHVVTPLTEDVATVRALLPPLEPGLMPVAGDNAAPALKRAGQLLQAAGVAHGEVILLSDGFADQAAAMTAAQALRAQGARLDVVGVGTLQGAPQPDGKGGFVAGSMTRLQADGLRHLASLGGGEYVSLTDLHQLINDLQAGASRALEDDSQKTGLQVAHWRNGGVWLLLPLLGVGVLLSRRGWV